MFFNNNIPIYVYRTSVVRESFIPCSDAHNIVSLVNKRTKLYCTETPETITIRLYFVVTAKSPKHTA